MLAPIACPYLLIQSDWSEVLKAEDGKVWISCKTMGAPAAYGTLQSSAQRKNPPRLTASKGFNVSAASTVELCQSIELFHSDPTCRCRFVAPKRTFQSIHSKSIVSLDVTDGGLGVSSSVDGKMHIWDTDRGVIRRPLEGHVGDVYTCRFFPSGVVVLSAGADMQLKVWSVETGNCVATMVGHISGILDTAIVERGRNVVSVGKDGMARLWDCSTSSCLTVLAYTDCEINACDLAETSNAITELASVDSNHGLIISGNTGSEVGTDGKLLLMACEDGTFRAIDIRSRERVFSIPCSVPVTSCCFVSATEVAYGRRDGVTLKLDIRVPSHQIAAWLDSSAPVLSLRAHPESGGVIAGKGTVINCPDGLCVLYEGDDGRVQLTGPDCDPIYRIASNRTHIFTCSRDGAIRKYSCVMPTSEQSPPTLTT